MKKSLLTTFILWMGVLLMAAPVSFGEEIFPASIKVEGPADLLNEIADDYAFDLVTKSAVHLFVTEEEHAELVNDYAGAIQNGEVTITFIQTAAEANANFQTKTTRSGRGYHTYSSMLSELRDIANRNSSFVKLYDIGNAEGGQHDIWALKISDNVASEEDEPGVYLTGAHHGNERPTVEMVMYTINHIVNNYNSSQDIKNLVNNTQIWMIPMVNPYGHTQNRRTNANGVDLNRNYPTSWAPLSEGETKAIVNGFLAKHHLVAGMDYHTYGNYYMSPWANTSQYPADHKALKALRDKMANSVGYQSVTINEFLGGGSGVSGSSCDYYYGKYAIFGYGVELGNSHSPSVSQMEQIVSKNLDASLMLLKRPLNATVTGYTTNNKSIVQATVKVQGVDDGNVLRNPVRSDKNYGRYYRMLEPGTYTLLFSYGGKTVKKSVTVKSSGQTIVDVDFNGANPDPDPPPPPPDPDKNSCVGHCGGKAPGGCYCDSQCANYGDCCADKVQACGY